MNDDQPAQNPASGGGGTATPTAPTPNPQSPQPSQPSEGQVEGPQDGGNSEPSDGGDGAADGDGRQRPGRAERRINELTRELRETQAKLQETSSFVEKLSQNPLDPSKVPLPDYSKMPEITPEQLKNDVIKAADAIATQRTSQAFTEFGERLTRRDYARKALDEIAQARREHKVLDDRSDDYSADIDDKLGSTYKRIYDRDPSYSFAEHVDTFLPGLIAEQNAGNGTSTPARSRGQSAVRPEGAGRRSQKRIEDMSMEELEAHIHAQNGR